MQAQHSTAHDRAAHGAASSLPGGAAVPTPQPCPSTRRARRWRRATSAICQDHVAAAGRLLLISQAYKDGSPSPLSSMDQVYSNRLSLLQPANTAPSRTSFSPQPKKPTWSSAPLIMHKIKATQNWQQLQKVIDEHQQQLTFIHLSGALVHFTRLMTGRHTRTPQHGGISHTNSQNGHAPTASTHSSSNGNGSDSLQGPGWSSAMDDSSIRDPAAHIHPKGAADLLRRLLSASIQQLEHYDVQGIANTLHCLAVLRYRDEHLIESLLAAVQYRMDTGIPQNLANIIWACVTLEYTPDRDWMALYYDALDARLPEFRAQDIANTLWAFGRLQFNGSQYKVAPNVVSRLLQQAYPQLGSFQPQHLANSLWGLGRLGFVPSEPWSQAFLAASQHRLAEMQPSELCSLVWAVSRLQVRSSEAWREAAVKACEPLLPGLEPGQLALLLVSLGSMQARPSAGWLVKAMAVSQAHAPHSTALVLTHTVKGISMLAYHREDQLELPTHAVKQWVDSQLARAWHLLGPAGMMHEHGGNTHQAHAEASSAAAGAPQHNGSNGTAALLHGEGAADSMQQQQQHTCSFTAFELGHLLYALARMGVQPPTAWLASVCAVLAYTPGLIEQAVPKGRQMCLLFWPLIRLLGTARKQQQGSRRSISSPGTNHSHSTPPAATGVTLIQRQQHSNTGSQQHLSQQGVSAVPSAGSQQHSQAVGAVSSLVLTALLDRYTEVSTRRIRRYKADELGVVLSLYAFLQHQPTNRWLASYWWRMYELLGQGQVSPGAMIRHLRAICQLGHQPHPAVWNGVRHTFKCTFQQYSPQQLCQLMQCMAHAGYKPSSGWLYRFLIATYQKWDGFQAGHWRGLLWSFATLQLQIPGPWMGRFFHTTQWQLKQFSMLQLVGVGQAVHQLQVSPPQTWVRAYHTACTSYLEAMPPAKLVACIVGASCMDTLPRLRWIKAAGTAVRARLKRRQLTKVQQEAVSRALKRIMGRMLNPANRTVRRTRLRPRRNRKLQIRCGVGMRQQQGVSKAVRQQQGSSKAGRQQQGPGAVQQQRISKVERQQQGSGALQQHGDMAGPSAAGSASASAASLPAAAVNRQSESALAGWQQAADAAAEEVSAAATSVHQADVAPGHNHSNSQARIASHGLEHSNGDDKGHVAASEHETAVHVNGKSPSNGHVDRAELEQPLRQYSGASL